MKIQIQKQWKLSLENCKKFVNYLLNYLLKIDILLLNQIDS